MTPERWQQVRAVFGAALEREPASRQAFLAVACAGDLGLRRDVESLVASHEAARSFLENSAALPPPGRLEPDSRLGPYEIVRLLGSGGMGHVYLARDPRLGREVALKLLPPEVAGDPDRRERLLREARAVSALNHPNICTIHEIGSAEGLDYICFEYIEGHTLDALLKEGALSLERLLDLALPLAEALAYAHAKGILHRDLKPANVMVTELGSPKVLDFGLAKLLPAAGTSGPEHTMLTKAGMVIGTVAYMSPEQALGRRLDERSDVFSFGALLYEMATGKKAFVGETPTEVLDAVLHGEPAPLAGLRPELPAPLSLVMERALRKDATERYQHMADLAADLRHLRRQSVSGAAMLVAAPGRSEPARSPGPPPAPRRHRLRTAGMVVALAAAALAAGVSIWRATRPDGRRVMLAVLPFENLSGDPEQEYLSDGLTEDMITELGRLWPRRLGVIARTSAMTYKRARKSVTEVGRELSVDYVLEGSVRPVAGRVRVTAQLIQVDDQSQVWAERYERGTGDLVSLQAEVARAIAREIPLRLTAEEQGRLTRSRPVRPEVHEAYLRGRYHWNQRTEEGVRKAVGYFEQAIAADPAWAPAYSGLADVYLTQFDYEFRPPAEAARSASQAARNALQLDPLLAEAHNSLAHVALHDWDWRSAEREFRRALELDPGYVPAYHWYALCLTTLGRTDEAVEAMRRARELDPLSLRINGDLGMALMAAGRHDEAIAQEKRTLELDPNFRGAYWIMGMAYQQKGQLDEAIRSYQEALKRAPGNPNYLAALGHAYAMSGRTAEARAIADDLTRRAATDSVSPFFIALVHAGLRDLDQAFAWLEKACAERSGSVRYLKVEPRLDPLRGDPRFHDLMRRVGLS